MPLSRSIEILRDLIAIPSVNPGRDGRVPAAIAGESRYAADVAARLGRLGIDATLLGPPHRQSVVGEIHVSDTADTVLIASHLDTVAVDGMVIDPFEPRLADGRVSGRGSCDTKAGMAALLAALERVLARGKPTRNVIVVGEADEEVASAGVAQVLTHLAGRRIDWALATEPTDLRLVGRHKGVVHARVGVRGRACHASIPGEGRNALVTLARCVLALDAHAAGLVQDTDPELGPATLSVDLAAAGHAENIVPDSGWFLLDRRLLPHEEPARVHNEIAALLRQVAGDDAAIEWWRLEKPALERPSGGHPGEAACAQALAAAGLPVRWDVASFGTDAGVLAAHGIPALVFGPGSIAQAHTADEWVAIDQVERASAFFAALLGQTD